VNIISLGIAEGAEAPTDSRVVCSGRNSVEELLITCGPATVRLVSSRVRVLYYSHSRR
jgi:hypothetical protein